jgi:transglutaminase-like putative cysteine protease
MQTKQFWDRKYLQSPVLYNGRAVILNNGQVVNKVVPYAVDVRQFIQAPNFVLEKIVKDEGIWGLNSYEDKALACLQFVRKHIEYTADKTSYGLNELWTFPGETLALGKGDCEDMSILLVSLLRNAGVPSYRIKVAAGWVVAGKNAPLGGHAYPLFLRQDEEWVALDPCYYPNDLPVSQRPPVKNDSNYKDVWFTFNDEYSWANKPVTVIRSVKLAK